MKLAGYIRGLGSDFAFEVNRQPVQRRIRSRVGNSPVGHDHSLELHRQSVSALTLFLFQSTSYFRGENIR